MKIIIPSYRRAESLTTPKWLHDGGITDYVVVVHGNDEALCYHRAGRVPNGKIMSSGLPPGISGQRQWIEDSLISNGEWYCSLDDNLTGWTQVHQDYYGEESLPVHSRVAKLDWRSIYDYPCSPREMMLQLDDMRRRAEHHKTSLCGFAVTDNFFFRERHWLFCSFVVTKAFLKKKSNIRWDVSLPCMEDLDQTAQHLLRDGAVLVNNFSVPEKLHYQPGGIGTKPERREMQAKARAMLLEKWPGLFLPLDRDGIDDVTMAICKPRQLDQWRRRMFLKQTPTLFDEQRESVLDVRG